MKIKTCIVIDFRQEKKNTFVGVFTTGDELEYVINEDGNTGLGK